MLAAMTPAEAAAFDGTLGPAPSGPDLITAGEVARLLGYAAASSVRALVHRGGLHPVGRGARGKALFDRAEVIAYARHRQRSAEEQRCGQAKRVEGNSDGLPGR